MHLPFSPTASGDSSSPGQHARPEHRPRSPPDGTLSPCPTHSCRIIHVRLTSQANILVDKDGTPRIAGLGNAFAFSHSTVQKMEGRASADRPPRGHALGLTWSVKSPHISDPTYLTEASDMYAFGVMAWEVWTDYSVRCWYIRSSEAGSHGATAIL